MSPNPSLPADHNRQTTGSTSSFVPMNAPESTKRATKQLVAQADTKPNELDASRAENISTLAGKKDKTKKETQECDTSSDNSRNSGHDQYTEECGVVTEESTGGSWWPILAVLPALGLSGGGDDPTVITGPTRVSLASNTPAGRDLADYNVNHGGVTFNLVGKDAEKFSLDKHSGQLKASDTGLDCIGKTYEVEIQALDAKGRLLHSKEVIISVAPPNTEDPSQGVKAVLDFHPTEGYSPLSGNYTKYSLKEIGVLASGTSANDADVLSVTMDPNAPVTFAWVNKEPIGGSDREILLLSPGSGKSDQYLAQFDYITFENLAYGFYDTAGAYFKIANSAVADSDCNQFLAVIAPSDLTGDWKGETLTGGNGNDILFGGKGNDILIGGGGKDLFVGGGGLDTFVIEGITDASDGVSMIIAQGNFNVEYADSNIEIRGLESTQFSDDKWTIDKWTIDKFSANETKEFFESANQKPWINGDTQPNIYSLTYTSDSNPALVAYIIIA